MFLCCYRSCVEQNGDHWIPVCAMTQRRATHWTPKVRPGCWSRVTELIICEESGYKYLSLRRGVFRRYDANQLISKSVKVQMWRRLCAEKSCLRKGASQFKYSVLYRDVGVLELLIASSKMVIANRTNWPPSPAISYHTACRLRVKAIENRINWQLRHGKDYNSEKINKSFTLLAAMFC